MTAPIPMGMRAHESMHELEVRADHARLVAQARANPRPGCERDRIRRYLAFKLVDSGLRLLASTSPTAKS
jgi:hypothetical protein